MGEAQMQQSVPHMNVGRNRWVWPWRLLLEIPMVVAAIVVALSLALGGYTPLLRAAVATAEMKVLGIMQPLNAAGYVLERSFGVPYPSDIADRYRDRFCDRVFKITWQHRGMPHAMRQEQCRRFWHDVARSNYASLSYVGATPAIVGLAVAYDGYLREAIEAWRDTSPLRVFSPNWPVATQHTMRLVLSQMSPAARAQIGIRVNRLAQVCTIYHTDPVQKAILSLVAARYIVSSDGVTAGDAHEMYLQAAAATFGAVSEALFLWRRRNLASDYCTVAYWLNDHLDNTPRN